MTTATTITTSTSYEGTGGAHVTDITFDGCHVGVSNGAASGRTIGSPRMGLECWCEDRLRRLAEHHPAQLRL